jgi:cell division initiation protein
MARKKDEGSPGPARLTPVDVQQVQFRRSLRGYDEQEVDDFLDRVTEELTQLLDERRSLTERAGSLPTVRVSSAADAAAASRHAEEIIRQARERADDIVRKAQQHASSAGGAGSAASAFTTGESHAAIAGFVAREREFLQKLAALVQGHAEGVKGMVASVRASSAASGSGPSSQARSESPSAGDATSGGAVDSAGSDDAEESASASSASTGTGDALGTGGAVRATSASPTSAGSTQAESETVVRLPDVAQRSESDPSRGSSTTSEEASPAGRAERGTNPPGRAVGEDQDPSLRDLFWGED